MKKTPSKHFIIQLAGICIVMLLCGTIAAKAQSPYSLRSAKMSISGTSSLHDWTENAGVVAWAGMIKIDNKQVVEIKNVTIRVPVTSIKSSQGKVMDTKTHEAFNHTVNPYITYKLSGVAIEKGVITAKGSLTMNGTLNTISLKINATVLSNGDVRFTGSHVINMKNYKMTPPTAVMGSIKVGEVVTVKYDLVVTPRK